MNILVVTSNNRGRVAPFILEQIESLKEYRVKIDLFLIRGRGFTGYLSNLRRFYKKISNNEYDIIHAHFGPSGFFANLQRKIPVITTYHGTDVNTYKGKWLSLLNSRLTAFNILTHEKQINQLFLKKYYDVIPCGINSEMFYPKDKNECRRLLGLSSKEYLVLFSSSFERPEKNARLAKNAVSGLSNYRLIEFNGYTRKESALLINAVDAILITSFYETGPLVAKEALACNKPVISTSVGYMPMLANITENVHLVPFESNEIRKKIKSVIESNQHVNSEKLKYEFSLKKASENIFKVYKLMNSKNISNNQ